MIYVLVFVDYDYYRFQNNLFASMQYSEVMEKALEINEKRKAKGLNEFTITQEYTGDFEHGLFRNENIKHLWIQKIANNSAITHKFLYKP